MAVYSYFRISEVESLQGGAGLRRQIDAEVVELNSLALEMGLGEARCYIDRNIRWTTPFRERDQATLLMDSLRAGDRLLVSSIGRIFSSCEDMEQTVNTLKKMGVRLFVRELDGEITDDAFVLPFSTMMQLFSQLESRRSAERIKAVKEDQRRQGRFLGGSRPFGYMIHSNGRLIENPMEQRVLKKIMDMHQKGQSLRAISQAVSTPMMPISFKTVQRILKRHARLPDGSIDRRRG